MAINPNLFLHDSDKAALTALKAIPGFTQLLKFVMKNGYEKQARIMNMGSNLRIDENQMPKYYHMLLPICEKLQIKVPELYISLNKSANARTFGDTDPYIVINSGLLETVPDELIPTVLAHECGHIVCRHTLYTMMGNLIMTGLDYAMDYVPTILGSAISTSLEVAFAYWMRCSELSADRVAAFCDGTPDKTIQLCMQFAGYDKKFYDVTPNVNAFLSQVDDYKKLTADNVWNKTLEFMWMHDMDHPISVLRAYECNEWAKSQQFEKIVRYLGSDDANRLSDGSDVPMEAPMPEDSKSFIGKETESVINTLEEAGFKNIRTVRTMEPGRVSKDGLVVEVLAEGNAFRQLDWLPDDTEIVITFFKAQTEEENVAAHPGMIRMPESSNKLAGRDYMDATVQLAAAGFTVIMAESQPIRIALFTKEGSVAKVTVNGEERFEKGDWFYPDAPVRITYNTAAQQTTPEK